MDLSIFSELLEKRPEINPGSLQQDLERYYLPYAQKLMELKRENEDRAVIVGVSAIQGAGKTTQGEIMELLLKSMGFSSVSLSIDDHYLTHEQLCKLREQDPRFIRRGVTHDIKLALQDLSRLQKMSPGQMIFSSGYDKGAHQGDGDRFAWVSFEPGLKVEGKVVSEKLRINKTIQETLGIELDKVYYQQQIIEIPENMGSMVPVFEHFLSTELIDFLRSKVNQNISFEGLEGGRVRVKVGEEEIEVSTEDLPKGWRLIKDPPQIIFYDGWMLGARPVMDESAFEQNFPALERPEDKEFAKLINKKLADYEPLWKLFDFLNVLYVPNYQISLTWRDRAEEVLRAKGEGMNKEEIREFVYYFWRSVHPAIHIKKLAQDVEHTDQVVIIADDHSVVEVLTPEQVREKYP